MADRSKKPGRNKEDFAKEYEKKGEQADDLFKAQQKIKRQRKALKKKPKT